MISWITLFLLAVLSTSRAVRGKFESKERNRNSEIKYQFNHSTENFVVLYFVKIFRWKKYWAGLKKKQNSDGCHICNGMLKVMSIIRHIIWAHLSSKITIFPLNYSLPILFYKRMKKIILLNLWNHGKLLFRLLLTYILSS